ncbi:hypothetical protein YTPLAS18_00370 [Nitrospira sp.]|nr:hypothetical protein YTPLAS18_00370 [Nitrospira sp.]
MTDVRMKLCMVERPYSRWLHSGAARRAIDRLSFVATASKIEPPSRQVRLLIRIPGIQPNF